MSSWPRSTRARYRDLLTKFEAVLPTLRVSEENVSLARLAEKELDRLRRDYEGLGDNPADDDLHSVRIRAKHARYAAELAATAEGEEFERLAEALSASRT